MCINIYHKKHIQNFSYTLVHHLNKKKKIKKFQIFSIISTKREDVPYDKYFLTLHLTLSHYNHLHSPWFLIQLYTRFSALYGQCLAISYELLCSCMVRNCLMYMSLRFTMCYFYLPYSPIRVFF